MKNIIASRSPKKLSPMTWFNGLRVNTTAPPAIATKIRIVTCITTISTASHFLRTIHQRLGISSGGAGIIGSSDLSYICNPAFELARPCRSRCGMSEDCIHEKQHNHDDDCLDSGLREVLVYKYSGSETDDGDSGR